MAKTKKTADPVLDEPEQPTVVEREMIGPEEPEELLGCQDGPEGNVFGANPQAPADLLPDPSLEYAVAGADALNLRARPGLDAPIIAVLPRGVGVFDSGRAEGDWWEVSTGRLTGWVLSTFLEPVWD